MILVRQFDYLRVNIIDHNKAIREGDGLQRGTCFGFNLEACIYWFIIDVSFLCESSGFIVTILATRLFWIVVVACGIGANWEIEVFVLCVLIEECLS